jgi:DNA polymerase III sliding clamp (beta) subunit (PCNA family)
MKEVKTNNGIKGGFLKGKPHYDSEGNSIGGIKAVVTDQGGKPVELEGNEVIINKKSVQSKKELTVKGTPKQILSTINQLDGNGVAIGDEEAEILAKYKTGGKIPNYHLGGDMSKHLAPNNEPSNLTHEQWHLVRTPEFKAWFGDWEEHPESSSKVVDENGEPLVVYHGSKNKFTVFDNSKIGMNYIYSERGGFFFTQKKITAVNYAKLHSLNEDNEGYLYECFLDIKNPSISETNSEYRAPADYYDVNRGDFLDIFYEDEDEDKEDGIIIFGTKKDNLYVASKSNQIKLADGINVSFDSNNDDIRYKRGGNIGKMTKSELKKFYASPEGKKLDAETYSEWERLVNMTKSELQDFYNSKEGKEAGLSSHEAKELGIDSGRTSARWIMKMKDIPYTKWNDKMWMWAKKQISFIKRMSGMRGDLYDEKGTKTPKHTSLLIWGHNPERKFNLGGAIDSSILINGYVSVQQIYVSENLTEEICLITYNSGGQSNLNVNDTMNATEMLKLFVDELDILSKNEFMQIIYDHRFNSNRIDSPEELDYYKNGFKTIIVDRDRIEFTNMPKKHNNELFAKGGEISTSSFYAERTINNWNEIPSTWKNTNKINKVNIEFNPNNSSFNSVFNKFLGTDQLRPVMSGYNVDEYGITCTNAHILATIPTTESLQNGIFLNGKQITGFYPNYSAVIPKDFISIHEFDCYKLLQYCKVALNYCNEITYLTTLKIGDSKVNYGIRFLITILETSIKLGYEKLFAHYKNESTPIVFSPVENPVLGTAPIFLCMPVLKQSSELGTKNIDYKLELNCYFDFNKNNIVNKDSSIVDFKMEYGENPVFTKEIIDLLKENIQKNPKILILEKFVVKDNSAICINSKNEIYKIKINNVVAPDGVYYIKNNVALKELDEASDYPKLPLPEDFVNRLTINSDYLRWVFETLELFRGNDDLRPVMNGLSINYDGNSLYFASTNAHYLGRIKASIPFKFENDKQFKIVVPFNKISELIKFNSEEDLTLEVYEKNINIISSDFESENRLIDGKFPNYDMVIFKETHKQLILNKENLNKALSSKEADSFIKKYKKEVDIISKIEEGKLVFYLAIISGRDKNFQIITDQKILTDDLSFNDDIDVYTTDSCLMIMPTMLKSENLFCFRLDYFKNFIKPVNKKLFDLSFNDTEKAYIINSDFFEYSPIKVDKKLKAEIKKGTEHEMEHLATLKKVAKGKLTPQEAVVETAKTHISENPEYYEDLEKMDLESKTVDELVALKKKLYSNVDIEKPMSTFEKLLNKVIAGKFSKINEEIANKHSKKSILESQIRGLELLVPIVESEQKNILEKQIRGLKLLINIV